MQQMPKSDETILVVDAEQGTDSNNWKFSFNQSRLSDLTPDEQKLFYEMRKQESTNSQAFGERLKAVYCWVLEKLKFSRPVTATPEASNSEALG